MVGRTTLSAKETELVIDTRTAVKAAVREWHPTCGTCGHWNGRDKNYGICDADWAYGLSPYQSTTGRNHYCADHTALNPPEGGEE